MVYDRFTGEERADDEVAIECSPNTANAHAWRLKPWNGCR
jgi:hypothetical protein